MVIFFSRNCHYPYAASIHTKFIRHTNFARKWNFFDWSGQRGKYPSLFCGINAYIFNLSCRAQRKQNNYFAGTWRECVIKSYKGEKSYFTFWLATDINLLLLCLILAVSVVQDSLILKISLLSCKPQGTWHQTGKSTRQPDRNNNTMRDPLRNYPKDHDYWSAWIQSLELF